VAFVLIWDKDNPLNLTWSVKARAYVSDDSEEGGKKLITADSDPETITRTAFDTKTGAEIQTLMINKSTEILQALGSGSGGHTIVNDLE
jgi:hypothetical protein